MCVCADLQLCGGLQGSSEDRDPGGHHRLRSSPLPSRPACGVHGQARLPLEAAGWCVCVCVCVCMLVGERVLLHFGDKKQVKKVRSFSVSHTHPLKAQNVALKRLCLAPLWRMAAVTIIASPINL